MITPYTVPKFELSAADASKFRKDIPETSFDKIDLGTSVLRFDVASVVTRPGGDTPDLSNVIVPLRHGKKRTNPRYFGFVLTAPTH